MIITPLSRSDFDAARVRLKAQGITIIGDQGSIEGHKVGISFFYNGDDTLSLSIEHKPFYFPESVIEDEIRKWFNQ